jgi:hypothetical protein
MPFLYSPTSKAKIKILEMKGGERIKSETNNHFITGRDACSQPEPSKK